MPLSAPARLRGPEPPEENPPRIIIVRPLREDSRRGALVGQDSFVSIDIEDDPDPGHSVMEVVVDSLGEPHPSSSQAASATGPAESDYKPTCRRTQSASADLSRTPFQFKTFPESETNTDRQVSGESISISSGSVNEIREPEDNEVQPRPSLSQNSISISSIEDETDAQDSSPAGNATPEADSGSVAVTLKLNPKDTSENLNASHTKKLNTRMKRLLFGVESKKPESEGIELHEIKSNQNLDLDLDSTDCQPNIVDSYKNLFTTARDLALATTSFTGPSRSDQEGGNGPSDSGGDGDSSEAESSTGRASRPRNSRMRGLVRMQMAARGMREDARRNAFVGTLSVLQAMMQFGYYLGVIPFRVAFDGAKYVMVTSRPRQIAVFVMLLVVIWCEANKTLKAVQAVNIKDYPGSLFYATEEVVRVWLLIAYAVVLYWKQKKFLLAFENFTHDFQPPRQNQSIRKKFGAKHVVFVFCCICLVIANWMAWAEKLLRSRSSLLGFLDVFYQIGTDVAGLPRVPRNKVYFWTVSNTFWAISTYSQVLKFYMEGMLWASAWTLYSIEKKTRSYTMNEDSFEINVGTETFRNVKKLVRNLNRALGPLRVVQFLVLIPYLVNIAYKAGNGEFDLVQIIQIPLQVGHFLVAAEASANMKNLIQHIVLFKINLSPQQIHNPADWHKLTIRQNFFAIIASTPIALEGMDFFEVSYVVLGNIAASVITYVLVILDWKRELPTAAPFSAETLMTFNPTP